MKFKDKIALVTGGSRGIGKAIVEDLSLSGATCYFTYINHTDEIEKINEDDNKVYPLKCDVKEFDEVKSMIEKIRETHKRIDFVVNNAGISRDKPLAMMPYSDWDDVIRTNLFGTFNVCRNVIMGMMKKKYGKIINISSISGIAGNASQSNYAASKAGIIGLSKSLAREVAAYNINVNVVAPGLIETDMTKQIPDRYVDMALDAIPFKRFGNVSDISSAVNYLLSDSGNYITGEVLKIDGGLVI